MAGSAFWVWVNSHGSFPLGIVALVVFAAGRRLDQEDASVELRALRYGLLGTALGVINPFGPRLLLFPLDLLSRQDVLRSIVEWRAPTYQSLGQRAFLVLLVLAVVAITRRPSWRVVLPVVVFVPLALLSARNLPVTTMIIVAVCAPLLSGPGTISGAERRSVFRPLTAVLVALSLVVLVGASRRSAFALGAYPADAVQFASAHSLLGGDARVVTPDFVGNYLELRYGRDARAFIDDRYDMLPVALVDDYGVLMRGGEGWREVLDRYEATAVMWRIDQPLAQLVKESDDWDVVYTDDDWLVATRR